MVSSSSNSFTTRKNETRLNDEDLVPRLSSGSIRNLQTYGLLIFSDVPGDITIVVDGESFLLHKWKDPSLSKFELLNLPGGSETFELAMKFCYSMNFEITTLNVASLLCVAEYLEMTEDYREENLVERTEAYLNQVVMQSLEKSIEVLVTCQSLPSIVEKVGILDKCVEGVSVNACKEQLVSGLSRLDCDDESTELKSNNSLDWWIEDICVLRIDYFERVIRALGQAGIHQNSIIESLMHYAQVSLKGIGKSHIWNPTKTKQNRGSIVENDQRKIVETLVDLFPVETRSSIPLSFLFGILKIAIILEASTSCRYQIEKRIAFRLEMVLLDDLLIPAVSPGDSLFDVDTIHRIVVNFLQRIEEEENDDSAYESDGYESPNHASLLNVGRLIDAYLAEIAPDPYLSLQKFVGMIELLPDYARVIDDGLYRAIDVYLKAHPMLSEQDCKKMCKFINCQKLSQEASNHALQNDRLPLQIVVRVLYFEQLRLKNTVSGNSGDGLFSQKISSSVPSAPASPRDNYACLRRENRELKLEITRMRARLSELEKKHTVMKQDMADNKSGNGRTFLTSLSKGIGRFGIFSRDQRKTTRKPRSSEGKKGRSRRYSVS